MREEWIGMAPGAALAMAAVLAATLTAAGPALAQSQTAPAQPSATSQGQSNQATPPPPKPAKHAKKTVPATPTNPDLDTEDQLAPSQMNQPVPAAVSEPGSAPAKPAHPATHAAATPPSSAHVVACSGLFGKDSSHLKLAMTYESKNVTFTDVDADGGAKVPASVLFPNDPKRRLEVW